MRIVEVIPQLRSIGGAERLVFDLIEAFASANEHEIVVISLYSRGVDQVEQALSRFKNVSVFFLGKKPGVDFGCAKRLRKLLHRIDPDAVHCHLDSLVTIWLANTTKKYPIYYTFHTLITEQVIGKKRAPKNILYRRLFKKGFVHPIAIAPTIKKAVCDYFNLPASKVSLIANGVPLSKFKTNSKTRDRMYDFIFIGRFVSLKNPLLIIEAMKQLLSHRPDAKLLMLGEGPLLQKCIQEAGEHLDHGIEIKGFVDDVSPYLQNAKTLLLPSTYEGNPMVINEAIASKCFIAATRVGGIPDIVNDRNGALIDLDENLLASLVKTMTWCIENEKDIGELLDQNYLENVALISIKQTADSYINLFLSKNA